MTTRRFEVRKDDVVEARWVDMPTEDLEDGQARLALGQVALTANNISYAVMGDRFGYWNFFPTGEEGWGCIPVWGYASVEASRVPGLDVGERIYGYFPMANHLTVTPVKLTESGFRDGAPHREALPAVYNDYVRTGSDPSYSPRKEPWRALFVPLAATGFGLADFLARQDYLGAKTVVSLSASSKTALGMAMLMQNREGVELVGMTSAGNRAAVEATGLYDRVLTYDEIGVLDASQPHVVVDFAGNGDLSARLHQHLGEGLVHHALVGASHADAPRKAPGMNAEKSVLFFMPGYAAERMKETGGKFLSEMMRAAFEVADKGASLLSLRTADGEDGIDTLYHAVLNGELSPTEGGIIRFGEGAV